jgi:hypothetical protein
MSEANPALPFGPGRDAEEQSQTAEWETQETHPGGRQEIRWKVVAKTSGITPAHIIAGRLQADGIPARAWQEAAGQAIGLTVGLLGTGHVEVPEEYYDQAIQLLESDEAFDEEE